MSSCAPLPPFFSDPGSANTVENERGTWVFCYKGGAKKSTAAAAEEGDEEPSSSAWRPGRLSMSLHTMQATSLTPSITLSDLLLQWLQSGTVKRDEELCVQSSDTTKQEEG